ncbi:MAG: helix-turn-helix domain-containing protein [Candidatus Eremiobacteraeota bacterium]|uniref:Helix-turn-helix domain-containing protein n=1 Tax=mine drainage metagenome TaxID=410659 RepID=E6PIM3_9ZZZZ|nr:helix-turn-helix domain-containing protein [Candidatus Eremiobacteraeota bacterium]
MASLQEPGTTQRRLTCSISEAGALLGIGRASAYEAARTGQIPTVTLGRRKVVPRAALERLLSGETRP